MRIFLKIIFVLGVFSMIGGLKHGVFFIGGAVLVIVSGIILTKSDSDTEIEENTNLILTDLNNKKYLLEESYKNETLNEEEFHEKRKFIDDEIKQIEEEILKKIDFQNFEVIEKNKIENLQQLKKNGLIDNIEFDQKINKLFEDFKARKLISKNLDPISSDQNLDLISKNDTSNEKEFWGSRDYWVAIAFFVIILVIIMIAILDIF